VEQYAGKRLAQENREQEYVNKEIGADFFHDNHL
jgi:hypothetical protein